MGGPRGVRHDAGAPLNDDPATVLRGGRRSTGRRRRCDASPSIDLAVEQLERNGRRADVHEVVEDVDRDVLRTPTP